MSGKSSGLAGTILMLALLVAVAGGAWLYLAQAKEIDEVRDRVEIVTGEARELSARTDEIIGDMANLRIERNKLRESLATLERKHAEANDRLAAMEADLLRVRSERDEHLAKRLDAERRLADALKQISKR
jgi:septal ring factor EnvC (AmiA/AmiB activator)